MDYLHENRIIRAFSNGSRNDTRVLEGLRDLCDKNGQADRISDQFARPAIWIWKGYN